MNRSSVPVVLLISALCCSASACKNETTSPETQVKEKPSEAFSWKDALTGAPAEAKQALGDYSGCNPQKKLPALLPHNQQFYLGGLPLCTFEGEPQKPHKAYRISAIVYSEGEPTLVELKPRSETTVAEVVENFELPEFPVERRMTVGKGENKHNKIALRTHRFDVEQGGVVGVDIFSKPDAPANVEYVQISALSKWHSIIPYAQIQQPPAVREELVLAAATSPGHVVDASLPYAAIGVDELSISSDVTVPQKVSDSKAFEPRVFKTASLSEQADAWKDGFSSLLEAWSTHNVPPGIKKDIYLTLAVDRNLPSSYLANFLDRSQQANVSRFEMLGRHVDKLTKPLSAYDDVRTTKLGYAPSVSGAAVRTPLKLQLEITLNGIGVRAKGVELPKVPGCPANGPTICMKDSSVDVSAEFKEARTLQREGKFEQSDAHVQKALAAYNWPELYGELVKIKRQFSHETIVFALPDDDVPVAVVMRALDVARYKRGSADSCADSFESNQALNNAQLCKQGEGHQARYVELFTDAVIAGSR